MNQEPIFSAAIKAMLQRRADAAHAAGAEEREESERLRLNLKQVEKTMQETIMPVFLAAAAALRASGCYVRIKEERIIPSREKSICLIASLIANATISGPPQLFHTLTYQANPSNLFFTCTEGDHRQALPIDSITHEEVTAKVTSFLSQL